MQLFRSTMHFASGRVRRKTSQFVLPECYVFRKISFNKTRRRKKYNADFRVEKKLKCLYDELIASKH